MRHLHTYIGWLFIWSFWIVVAAITYQYLDNKPPVEFIGAEFIDYDRENSVAVIEVRAIRNRYCPGVIRRILEDGLIVVLPDIYISPDGLDPIKEEEGIHVWRVPVPIPSYSAGEVIYRSEVLYSCNSLQHFIPLRVQAPEVRFWVPGEQDVQELLQGGG